MKAISPVIATILLVMIAVAASVFLWVWLSGYVTSTSSEVETGTETVKVAVKIDGVKYDSATQKVTIYVTNIGGVAANITSAYVLDSKGNVVASNTSANLKLDPGATGSVDVTGANLVSGDTYVAKVVTSEGVEATYTFTAS